MTREEKKLYIYAALQNPNEKRSYNEIQADLELKLWYERFNS